MKDAQETTAALRRRDPLFEYLKNRFADRVVLSFMEIEDLLGVALPAAARTDPGWWTAPETDAEAPVRSWTMANRTARPNLRAMSVLFERA